MKDESKYIAELFRCLLLSLPPHTFSERTCGWEVGPLQQADIWHLTYIPKYMNKILSLQLGAQFTSSFFFISGSDIHTIASSMYLASHVHLQEGRLSSNVCQTHRPQKHMLPCPPPHCSLNAWVNLQLHTLRVHQQPYSDVRIDVLKHVMLHRLGKFPLPNCMFQHTGCYN